VKKIQIHLNENKEIEGIKLIGWEYEKTRADEDGWPQKIRSFGKTTNADNICSECEIDLARDEVITGLSYRKSTAGVEKIRKFLEIFEYLIDPISQWIQMQYVD